MAKNYYGYRIDIRNIKFFNNELEKGRLRQGWGYEEYHKLPDTTDEGARGNLPIYKKVKKDDILLIPRLPNWNDVTIARATEDFETGYRFEIFEISKEQRDYGHIFPVEKIKHFSRYNKNIDDVLQRALRRIPRFWQINCGESIEKIINSNEDQSITHEARFRKSLTEAFDNSFDDKKFKDLIIDNAKKSFINEGWEFALVEALNIIYPAPYFEVTREGGKEEKKHGTDILIKIFGLADIKYGIAIQVKDWWGKAEEWAIDQLNKADAYWEKEKGIKLIDKILIVTRANCEENKDFKKLCGDNKIKLLFEEELSGLLYEVGKTALLSSWNINNSSQ